MNLHKNIMKNWASYTAAGFFAFILWVISVANTNIHSPIFDWVKAMPYGDKFGHLVIFGTLTYLSILAFKRRCLSLLGLNIYWGFAIVVAFVIAEECSQLFIASRTFDLKDLTADFLGISMATALAFKTATHKAQRPRDDTDTAG